MLVFGIVDVYLARVFSDCYKVIDQYLITNILAFVRGFEAAIVLIAAAVFLLIAVGIMIREAKRLPISYSIESYDLDGKYTSIDGLRHSCSTHDVAESYARYYRQLYARQYTFKVVGSAERVKNRIEKQS